MESPSGNIANDIHDHAEAQQLGFNVEIGHIFMQDLNSGTSG